jgi:thiol-disulfide isomerase/thioredoxin
MQIEVNADDDSECVSFQGERIPLRKDKRMKRLNLETAANLAMLIAAIVVAVSYIHQQQRPRAAVRTAISRGDTIPAIQNMDLRKAANSIVVVARESCPYCVASMPFYKALATAARAKRADGHLQILFLTTDPTEMATQYLRAGGVEVDKIISLTADELDELNIQGTPTLLLVNRSGTVREVWVGKLDSERERAALAALGLT